jgi:hypothetical protein
MRVSVEYLVERTTIAGETEVLGENLPQRHFIPPQIPHDQVRSLLAKLITPAKNQKCITQTFSFDHAVFFF